MKKGVSKIEVFDFKENWCNENKIIAELISTKLFSYFVPPILDVGTGLGDIAYNAFPYKEAICIDVNRVEGKEFPVSKYHKHRRVNFFEYYSAEKINTVFICHTLQFIDEDIDLLNEKIAEIDPENLIIVLNKNDDFMGDLIKWTKLHTDDSNPEVRLSGFPKGYRLKKRLNFRARLQCPDLDKLARQIGYLMVIDLKNIHPHLKSFLKLKLGKRTGFSFKQSIEIYQKNGR